jgi:hypothetical protein
VTREEPQQRHGRVLTQAEFEALEAGFRNQANELVELREQVAFLTDLLL